MIGRHLVRYLVRRSTAHRVSMGTDNGLVAVMRFVRGTVVITGGESVVFLNGGTFMRRTGSTFGRGAAAALRVRSVRDPGP